MLSVHDIGAEPIEKFAQRALERPSDFGWFGRDEMFVTWGWSGISKHRDSNLIDQSNWEVSLELLDEKAKEEGWEYEVIGMGHWLVGHADAVIVPVLKDDADRDNITEDDVTDIFKWILEELIAPLAEYPILDEMHHSDMEWEQAIKYIKQEAPYWVDIPDDYYGEVYEELINLFDYQNEDGQGSWYNSDQITEACWNLGLMTEDEDDFIEGMERCISEEEIEKFKNWCDAVRTHIPGQLEIGDAE